MIAEIAHLGLVEDEAIVLDAAALELAALDHPQVDIDRYSAFLGSITEKVRSHANDVRSATGQANVLAEVIATDHGFLGDRETYDDPANADMIRVIDRRRGLPVSLSILYVAAARRVGWQAEALNTPGHVLVRIGAEPAPLLIDPFNGGAKVDAHQLARLLASVAGQGDAAAGEHVAPMSNRSVLVRLLVNQATRAEQAGDADRAVTLYDRITTIAPSYAHGWWEHARLELVRSNISEARASLSAMLEITRDPDLRFQISAALDALTS